MLVARHENDISATTDVASHPEFAARRITKTVDGVQITGWFTEDFTLAELRTLRAKERIPDIRPENTAFDGTQVVPTFQEVIDENTFLPADFRQGNPASPVFPRARGDAPAEYRLFFGLGVDGLFSDDSDTAVATRTQMFGERG